MNEPTGGQLERVRSALSQYEGPLLRYAQRITGDLHRARDVVQETFLRLWREESDDLNGRLPQWLYTVCRNYALDVRRKETRMTTLAEPLAAETPAREPPPDESAATHETADRILHWLDGLPANQQEVVRLKFQNGLRYRQIAEITGLTETNVGFLIHKGIKTLRERARRMSVDNK
ncbi:MAG: RNA polymerase sigma factor [Planctomycetaceae bacterium]